MEKSWSFEYSEVLLLGVLVGFSGIKGGYVIKSLLAFWGMADLCFC